MENTDFHTLTGIGMENIDVDNSFESRVWVFHDDLIKWKHFPPY